MSVPVYGSTRVLWNAHQLICRHERNYGKHQWIISLDHYLSTLSRKPGALHGSVALTLAPEAVRVVYDTWFKNQPRDFIHLLQYCQQHQIDHQRLLDTCFNVNGICPNNVTGEKIMALLGNHPATETIIHEDQPSNEIESFSNRQLEEISNLMFVNMEELV